MKDNSIPDNQYVFKIDQAVSWSSYDDPTVLAPKREPGVMCSPGPSSRLADPGRGSRPGHSDPVPLCETRYEMRAAISVLPYMCGHSR